MTNIGVQPAGVLAWHDPPAPRGSGGVRMVTVTVSAWYPHGIQAGPPEAWPAQSDRWNTS